MKEKIFIFLSFIFHFSVITAIINKYVDRLNYNFDEYCVKHGYDTVKMADIDDKVSKLKNYCVHFQLLCCLFVKRRYTQKL